MSSPRRNEKPISPARVPTNWLRCGSQLVLALRIAATVVIVLVAFAFGFFPAATTAQLALDSSLRERGQVGDLGAWFLATQRRYDRWAADYRRSQHAATVQSGDVAATEWPLFGSVFYLLSAEELLKTKQLALTSELRMSLTGAAKVVADPVSATWVRQKWGESYLERENVFYRMLVMLGLQSYANMIGDRTYAPLVERHARGLSEELARAPYHVLDDYPGECYPNDVIWAAAAISRVQALPASTRSELSRQVVTSIAQRLGDEHGLPAMLVDARMGNILQPSRGCSNSGLLSLVWELSPPIAEDWYRRYAAHFWLGNRWIVGFREHPVGAKATFSDVDSGPILFDVGTVASVFGIGAARAAGRFDHAAPITMEVIAASWPTPFGLLVPGIMGWAAADSWCLGETALLFAMTRPNYRVTATPFSGHAPLVVWGFVLLYAALGAGLTLREWRYWRTHYNSRTTLASPSATRASRS